MQLALQLIFSLFDELFEVLDVCALSHLVNSQNFVFIGTHGMTECVAINPFAPLA